MCLCAQRDRTVRDEGQIQKNIPPSATSGSVIINIPDIII